MKLGTMSVFVFSTVSSYFRRLHYEFKSHVHLSKRRSDGPVLYDTVCTHVALVCSGTCPTGRTYPASVRKFSLITKVTSLALDT
jgi:hypothetical protein